MSDRPTWKQDLLLGGLFVALAMAVFLGAWMLSRPPGIGLTEFHPPKPRLETHGVLVPVSREWGIPCVAWRPNRDSQWRLHCSPTAVYRGTTDGE